MRKPKNPASKISRLERRLKSLQHSGRLLYAVIGLAFTGGIGATTLYQSYNSRLPNLKIAIRQERNTIAIGERPAWKAFKKAKFTLASEGPLIATLDEENGPAAVALVIQQVLLFFQFQIIQSSDIINAHPIQRDVVKRSITDKFDACSAESVALYPKIYIDIDISNAGGATVLWLAETRLHAIRKDSTNIFSRELDIGNNRRIDSAGEKHFCATYTFVIDNIIDLTEIATASLTNLFYKSDVARSNLWPFIKHVSTSRVEDINAVINSAPPFANPSVFSPCIDDFRNRMYEKLRSTQFYLELLLYDSHDNTYRAKMPIQLEIKEGVASTDKWAVVSISAIHELRMMDERFNSLGLSWKALPDFFIHQANSNVDACTPTQANP